MRSTQIMMGISIPEWKSRARPQPIIMQGQYCILEPYDFDKHGEKLFSALQTHNYDSWAYLPYGPCKTLQEFQECMQKIMNDKNTLLYAILDALEHKPIGVSGYLRINPEHGTIEVGHLHYSSFLQKKAAATEAMYLMMRYAFEDLGYRRYEWKCNDLNEPSKKAATRLGFTFEGIFRQSNVFKGHNRDTAWYSIIDSEWPTIKEKLEVWLNSNNFDSQGKQINSLSKEYIV